jgi:hypothetical protein
MLIKNVVYVLNGLEMPVYETNKEYFALGGGMMIKLDARMVAEAAKSGKPVKLAPPVKAAPAEKPEGPKA